jgi:protein-S-isoprenylcysteine O-methyltransferase Ste14
LERSNKKVLAKGAPRPQDTAIVYITPAKIIDKTNKKRYMNIKIKAALTVLIFFSTLTGMAWILTKIPPEWIINGFLCLMAIGCMIIAYYMALGYYRDVEELKKLNEQDKRKIEGGNSRIK